jgi:PPM family protein phosphatase
LAIGSLAAVPQQETSPPSTSRISSLRVTVAGLTDVGRVRDHNEDSMRLYPDLDLFIVADGMGGHNAGEVASALAAASIENCFRASVHGAVDEALLADPRSLPEPARRLVASVRKANADVFEISSTHVEHKGMGTTVVALHVSLASGEVHVAHVGDSRCYRVRDGQIEPMTRDHSLISDALAWKPDITEEELAFLPKNMISRAVGRKASVEVDIRTERAIPGDIYLVCSDGLHGMISDRQILEIVRGAGDLDAACSALIAAANAAGGEDNVTAVLVRVDAGL